MEINVDNASTTDYTSTHVGLGEAWGGAEHVAINSFQKFCCSSFPLISDESKIKLVIFVSHFGFSSPFLFRNQQWASVREKWDLARFAAIRLEKPYHHHHHHDSTQTHLFSSSGESILVVASWAQHNRKPTNCNSLLYPYYCCLLGLLCIIVIVLLAVFVSLTKHKSWNSTEKGESSECKAEPEWDSFLPSIKETFLYLSHPRVILLGTKPRFIYCSNLQYRLLHLPLQRSNHVRKKIHWSIGG